MVDMVFPFKSIVCFLFATGFLTRGEFFYQRENLILWFLGWEGLNKHNLRIQVDSGRVSS